MSDNWNTRQTLLRRAQNPDDHEAWDEFVIYYKDFISIILYQMRLNVSDKDDLVQEILLKIWKSLPKLEYDRDKARFRTWLSHLIRNKVLDYFRKKKRLQDKKGALEEEVCEETEILSPDIEKIIQKEWEVYIVKLALKNISDNFSGKAIEAFELSMNDIPLEQISAKLSIKTNSVTKLKNRVKYRLVKEIDRLRSELEFV